MVVAEGDLNEKIRLARKYHRPPLTQEELAVRIQSSRGLIANYEVGARIPPHDMVLRISDVLKVPIEWFYDGRPGPPPLGPESQNKSPGIMQYPPAPSNEAHIYAEPAVGRRKFPMVGSAGAATFPLSSPDPWPGDFVEFSDDLYRPERFVVQVQGDSMHPRFEHGDYILVQPAPEVPQGLIAIARNPIYEYVTKVMRIVNGMPELHPINSGYEVIQPGNDWLIVGYAVGRRQERGIGRYLEEGDNAGLRP